MRTAPGGTFVARYLWTGVGRSTGETWGSSGTASPAHRGGVLAPDPEEALAYGLFARRQALAAGIPAKEIARRLRTGRWRRLEFGIYEDVGRAACEGDGTVRAFLRAGPSAVASHLTAADALGWDLLELPPLQFTVPEAHGGGATNRPVRTKGAAIFRRNLTADELATLGALRLTAPLRTAVDIATDCPLTDAVVAVDSGLRIRHLTVDELHVSSARRRNWPGFPRLRRVLALLDPLSGSVPESVARVLFTEAGLPAPETQFVVRRADGTFAGRADFAWPEVLLIVEIDGFAWHSSQDALQSDHDRQNDFELAGYTVLRFTAKDVRERPGKVTRLVCEALRQRGC